MEKLLDIIMYGPLYYCMGIVFFAFAVPLVEQLAAAIWDIVATPFRLINRLISCFKGN